MTKKQHRIITVLSILVMVLILLISRRLWVRADLTSAGAYTLSPASRKLHAEITEQVRITYYLSGKLLSVDAAPQEIADLLREYEARSRGRIQTAVKDPGKDAAQAERFGLVPQQLQNVEQDEASFSMVYSGIVIEYLDRYEVLPWVFSLDTLEYDITSRIRALTSGKKRELGVIAADSGKSWNDYYNILSQVFTQSGYSVLNLRPGEEIPDTLPVLFVFGGAEIFDEPGLYRIDRYIRLGGRVLFAVETVDVDVINTWDARLKNDKGLLAMISSYGVTVGQGLVMDPASLAIPYQDPVSRQVKRLRYFPWVSALDEFTNREHPLTAGGGGVDLFWASPLSFTLPESGTVKGEILLSSTPEAWLMTKDFAVRPEENYAFTAEADVTGGTKILAAALEGRFPGWFEGTGKPGLPAENPSPESPDILDFMDGADYGSAFAGELPDMPAEAKDSRIVVVGDSDLGSMLIQYAQSQQNLNFLLQAADWLGNDGDIVGIRNRTSASGRLDRITDETKRTGMMAFSRILNTFLAPLAVAAFGMYRLLKRKYKADAVRKEQDHAL